MASASDVNREFYDHALPGRDDYWRKMAAPRARVAELLRQVGELRPARLVDLGSGGGQLLEEVRGRYPEVELAGLDISAAQVKANGARLPGIDWRVVDLGQRGASPADLEGGFDVVIASEIIEHLDDPGALLHNAHRLARRGTGRLLLSTQSGPVRETERRVGHRRHWTKGEMEALFNANGWEPTDVRNEGFPFHDLSKWYANLDPDRSMAEFAERPYGLRENLVCYALRTAFRLNSRTRGAQLFAVARRKDV